MLSDANTASSKFRKPLDIGLLCSGVSEEEQGFVVEQPNLGRVPNGSCKLSSEKAKDTSLKINSRL